MKKKYCELPDCRKIARHHFSVGHISPQENHSMCKRHYKKTVELIRKQEAKIQHELSSAVLEKIKKGEKVSFSDTLRYLEFVGETFGDGEASGVLNVLLTSLRVRNNCEPTDKEWEQRFHRYRSYSIKKKLVIDTLADGLNNKESRESFLKQCHETEVKK